MYAIYTCLSLLIAIVPNFVLSKDVSKDESVCIDDACVSVADSILNGMDTTIDPCNDFYSFACGNWIKQTKIPEDHAKYGVFDHLKDEMDDNLRIILGANIDEADIAPVKFVKQLFQMCSNESKYRILTLNKK